MSESVAGAEHLPEYTLVFFFFFFFLMNRVCVRDADWSWMAFFFLWLSDWSRGFGLAPCRGLCVVSGAALLFNLDTEAI